VNPAKDTTSGGIKYSRNKTRGATKHVNREAEEKRFPDYSTQPSSQAWHSSNNPTMDYAESYGSSSSSIFDLDGSSSMDTPIHPESRVPRPLDHYTLQVYDEVLDMMHVNPASMESQEEIIARFLNECRVYGTIGVCDDDAGGRWFVEIVADLGATPNHWWIGQTHYLMMMPTLHLQMNAMGCVQRLLNCIEPPGAGNRILPSIFGYDSPNAQKHLASVKDTHKVCTI
jgi:hypothetical protein